MQEFPTARLVRGRAYLVTALVLLAVVVWGVWHVFSVQAFFAGHGSRFTFLFVLTYFLLAGQITFAYLDRPTKVTPQQHAALDELNVVVAVPVYNEDPEALRLGLESLLQQMRRVQYIHIVENGPRGKDYQNVISWLTIAAPTYGVQWRWDYNKRASKRHAQGVVFRSHPEADIFFTVDSDGLQDRNALRELLKPLVDPLVTSVAGIVLALNNQENILARFTDLWFVTSQLIARSAQSVWKSVLVNSGPIAVYRADIVRENLDVYLSETFGGKYVEFSDDSMLTLFAKLAYGGKAKTVQQPTAFAFSLMPVRVRHHLRQWERWMRGSTIRSFWRFRYLQMASPAYWLHLWTWMQTFLSVAVSVWLFIAYHNSLTWQLALTFVLVPILLGYVQSLKYLTIRRSDVSAWSKAFNYFLLPLALIWALTVLRFVRWYAVATILRMDWGTRKNGVEVGL